jgi:hypothetical protein
MDNGKIIQEKLRNKGVMMLDTHELGVEHSLSE